MRKIISSILEMFAEKIRGKESKVDVFEQIKEEDKTSPQVKKSQKIKKKELVYYQENTIRDVIDLMEFPFLSLSKDRTQPIVYESEDRTQKVVISGHRGHFVASIYDWDIILVVAGKIQEIINRGSDIPPRTIIIPRHELLKALHKQIGRKEQKDLEKSLDRLKLTGISTTINNKDYRHRAGFGFIDSWRYSERKNDRETKIIQVTLSEWLYELCCAQGSLLKSNSLYFDITSGLQKFLYRTARKHAGENKKGWWLTIEELYKKSGSEGSLKLFKSRLKKIVFESKIPDYYMEWIEENGKEKVLFKKHNFQDNIQVLDRLAEECTKKQQNTNNFNKLNDSNQ